jgi:hypothetical protein
MTQFDGLWRNPAFLRFWAADTVSVFGSLITRIALPFTAILMLDASAFEMSLLVLADLVRALGVGLAMIAGLLVAGLLLMPLTAAQGHGALAAVCRATLGLGGAVVTLGAIFLAFTPLRSLKTMPASATPALNG